jgi:hypothetical protein
MSVCSTRDQTLSAPEEYMAPGHNRYAAFNQISCTKHMHLSNSLGHYNPLTAGSNLLLVLYHVYIYSQIVLAGKQNFCIQTK